MSRSLLLVAALALLAPAATAQAPGPDVAVAIGSVPAEVVATESIASIPVTLNVDVNNFVCLPGPGELTVGITAAFAPANGTSGNLTIDPVSVTVALPAAGAGPQSVSESKPVNVVIRASRATSGTLTLTPTYGPLENCTAVSASGLGTPVSFDARFAGTNTTVTGNLGDEAPVPGVALPAAALALVAAAFVVGRRRNA